MARWVYESDPEFEYMIQESFPEAYYRRKDSMVHPEGSRFNFKELEKLIKTNPEMAKHYMKLSNPSPNEVMDWLVSEYDVETTHKIVKYLIDEGYISLNDFKNTPYFNYISTFYKGHGGGFGKRSKFGNKIYITPKAEEFAAKNNINISGIKPKNRYQITLNDVKRHAKKLERSDLKKHIFKHGKELTIAILLTAALGTGTYPLTKKGQFNQKWLQEMLEHPYVAPYAEKMLKMTKAGINPVLV